MSKMSRRTRMTTFMKPAVTNYGGSSIPRPPRVEMRKFEHVANLNLVRKYYYWIRNCIRLVIIAIMSIIFTKMGYGVMDSPILFSVSIYLLFVILNNLQARYMPDI